MTADYRVAKAYHLVNDETGPMDQLAAILTFQGVWAGLTRTQRAVLLGDDRRPINRKATLANLRAKLLVDDAGRTTPLGEAVLHYRPGSDG